MVETKNVVKAGRLFVITQGEYSSYGMTGHFLALEDIDDTVLQEAADKTPGDEDGDKSVSGLIAELIRGGKVMEIDVQEICADFDYSGKNFSAYWHS